MTGIIASKCPRADEFASPKGDIAVIREARKRSQQSIKGGKNA